MINKFFKLINNKFSIFFKFVFFLRYLFLIFFVALVLFLSIPQFFDYKKKEEIIKIYLSQNYGLKIKELGKIEFNSFPVPNLQINELSANYFSKNINLKTRKLVIYPEILSIYNFNNFHLRKIKLKTAEIETDFKNFYFFNKNILNVKKKISFENSNLKINDNKINIIEIKNINFLNYGYKKNKVIGKLFDRKFEIDIKDDFRKIDFKLIKTGISATLNIFEKKKNFLAGNLKGKILKSNFKLKFFYNGNKIDISDFYFRDKKISFDSEGQIELKPFLKPNINFNVKNIDEDLLKNFSLNKLHKYKNFIKKINSTNMIIFRSNRFSNNFFTSIDIKSDLAYGRVILKKNFLIANTDIKCESNINLIEDFPIFYFDCFLNSPDKKILMKKIKIDYKNKNETLILNAKGSLNIINNKVNFDKIEVNKDYRATVEDLEYFKNSFENILFDENFIKIFDLSKLRRFISEVS